MSYFKAKMHEIRFRLGSARDPARRAYSAPSDPLAGFKGAASMEGGEERYDTILDAILTCSRKPT